jgi:hypothetical protein
LDFAGRSKQYPHSKAIYSRAADQSHLQSPEDKNIADDMMAQLAACCVAVTRLTGEERCCHSDVFAAMDDLLKRADLAIHEARRVREETRNDVANARMAAVRVRATVLFARRERERSVGLS